jgi:hypothetical protein
MQEQIRAVRGDRSRQFLIDTDIIYLPVTSPNMRRVIAAFGRPEIPQPVSDRTHCGPSRPAAFEKAIQ